MALNTFLDFSTTAASNVDVAGIGIQGANAVSNFDNAFRQLMAILRRDLDNGMVLASKSANYTAVANDNNALIRFSAAATLSLTAAATLGADWHCWVMADGGAVIIDPNSSETINGATTITIPDGRSTLIICDGTNFRALEDYARVDNWVDVASATTTDIGAAASQNVRITGTTTITGLGTVAAGTFRRVRFAGALTLTYNATSLILPGAANITTAAGDVAEFISEGSGNWRCVDYQRQANLPIRSVVQQVFTSSGTYTPTAGMAFCVVECVGGGGGGGGARATASSGGGGGGGGAGQYARSRLTASQIGVNQTATVGAGGSAGANTGGNGGSGGQSSIGSLVIAPGGNGGIGTALSSVSSISGNGGAGGSGGTGDVLVEGGPGDPGSVNATSTAVYPRSGSGGASYFGGGHRGVSANGTGASAGSPSTSAYGGGGSGGVEYAQATGALGGAGASGVIIVTEFCV